MVKKRIKVLKLTSNIKRAPYWKRIIAYFIDMLLLSVVVVLPLTGAWKNPLGSWEQVSFFGVMLAAILIVVYFTLMEYRYHQTLGKMVLGLKVNGNYDLASLLLRNVVKFSSLLLVIDCIAFLFKKDRRRFTEYWSDTWVGEVDEKSF